MQMGHSWKDKSSFGRILVTAANSVNRLEHPLQERSDMMKRRIREKNGRLIRGNLQEYLSMLVLYDELEALPHAHTEHGLSVQSAPIPRKGKIISSEISIPPTWSVVCAAGNKLRQHIRRDSNAL